MCLCDCLQVNGGSIVSRSVLQVLPDDILESIMVEVLDSKGALVRLKLVCKRFKQVLDVHYRQELIWERIVKKAFTTRESTVAPLSMYVGSASNKWQR